MRSRLLSTILVAGVLITSAFAMDPVLLDTTSQPADDFYRFACGKWLDSNSLPPSTTRFNTFSLLAENVNQQLIAAFLRAESDHGVGGNAHFLGLLFSSGMSQDSTADICLESLQNELEQIRSIGSMDSLVVLLAQLHRQGFSPLFRIHEPARWELRGLPETLFLHQAGLGLPNPGYYDDSDSLQTLREAYRTHIAAMFELSGEPAEQANGDADRTLTLETAIAALWSPPPASPHNYFNLKSSDWFVESIPGFHWPTWFEELGIPTQEQVLLGEPDYFVALDQLLASYDLATWKAYLGWQVLVGLTPALPASFREEQDRFYRSYLPSRHGKPKSDEDRILACMIRALPEAVDQFYLNEFYPDSLRLSVENLLVTIEEAIQRKLTAADWMSTYERKLSLKKMETMKVKLGGTSVRTDFGRLTLDRHDFTGNILQARRFHMDLYLARLGLPRDDETWPHESYSMNLAYDVNRNSIAIDASNFQPPFYSPDMDLDERYAWLGVSLAHEMGHAFDEQARYYSETGKQLGFYGKWRLSDQFDKKIQALRNQYDQYEVLPGVFVDGTATSIEAFADQFGAEIAFDAYEHEVNKATSTALFDDGYTPEQRFFISYAQVWKEVISPDAQKRQARGPHPPANIRAIAPLQNMDAFYEAFEIQPGDPMYLPPSERVHFW